MIDKVQKLKKQCSEEGVGIIDVIISIAVVSVAFWGFSQIAILGFKILERSEIATEAAYLAEEGIEAVKSVRNESWSTNIAILNVGQDYFPMVSGTKWILVTDDPGLINNRLKRTVTFDRVYRDANDNISEIGTEDPGTRKVTASIFWGETLESAVEFTGGTTDTDLASFPSNSGWGDPAQSFTTLSEDISVSKGELFIKKVTANPSNIYLEIRSGSTVGSIIGTSQIVNSGALPSSLSWVSFNFSPAVNLNGSTQYFFRIRSQPDSTVPFSGAEGTIHWGYLQTGPSPYGSGDAYRYVGRNNNPGDAGQKLNQYDFSFRVYKTVIGGKTYRVVTYLTNFLFN